MQKKRIVNIPLCILLVILQFFVYVFQPAWVNAADVNPSPKPPDNKVIAVADFTNDTGDTSLDYLKKGLANAIITKLAAYPNLTLVERGRLEAVMKELGLGETGVIDANTAAKVGNALGANAIIVGGLFKAGTRLRLNVRFIDVNTIKVIFAVSEDGNSQEEILNLIDKVSEKIAQSFDTNNKIVASPTPIPMPTPTPSIKQIDLGPVEIKDSTNTKTQWEESKGLPTWAWIAIGVGVVAVVAGVIILTSPAKKPQLLPPLQNPPQPIPNPQPTPKPLPFFITPAGITIPF